MKKYRLGVLAGYEQTINEMIVSIDNIFGEYVEFESLHLAQLDGHKINQLDLVVSSSEYLVTFVRETYKITIPMIAAQRNIDVSVVPQLLALDKGTKVYVLGVGREAAEEIIRALQEIGIYHLDLTPYYYQKQLSNMDILIAPVRVKQLEKTVKKYISIEYNVLNIFSIMELVVALGFPNKHLRKILDKFQNDTTNVNQRTEYLIQNLQALVENSSEGLLVVNGDGVLLTCNQRAKELLDLPNSSGFGYNLQDLELSSSLKSMLLKESESLNEILDIGSKRIIFNKKFLPNRASGYLVYFQDIKKVQKVEHIIRYSNSRRGLKAKYDFTDIAGNSPIIKRRIEEAKRLSKTNYSVLIQGDNGTGKELFAQAIHNYSLRKNEAFVPVNIASISDSLLESELFGYEEGAFTGANKGGRTGLFELAHRGTLFFDEIGDASDAIQQKLLRVLQEHEIFRVGGTQLIKIDVRIIAATNRDLFSLVKEGKFRKDLYYRLKVLQLNLPTLQERPEDIPHFVDYFFKTIGSEKRLNAEALGVLQQYSWPGNVRELYNLICYFDSIYDDQLITPEHIPNEYFESEFQAHSDLLSMQEPLNFEALSEEMDQILTIFGNARMPLSTMKIHKIMRDNQVDMTRSQVRYRMEKLRNLGYLKTGTTKQGTSLSTKGREYLMNKSTG